MSKPPKPNVSGQSPPKAKSKRTGGAKATKKLGTSKSVGSIASAQAQEIIDHLRYLLAPDQIVYVFVNGPNRLEGYYDPAHYHKLAADVLKHSGTAQGIYHGLNPVNSLLLARAKNRLVAASTAVSPKNDDVVSRRLLLIDCDPVRPLKFKDRSATDNELRAARLKSIEVRDYLITIGWPKPMRVMSGNGSHLIYRIDVPTDDQGLIKRVLKALSNLFSNDAVKIDTVVHDARRITKLPGTKACKGAATPNRPHRTSKVLYRPKKLRVVPTAALETLGAEKPVGKPIQSSTVSSIKIGPDHIQRATKYIAKIPPAVEGKNGSSTMFATAALLLDGFALPREVALGLIHEYNARCLPPFSIEELDHKFDDAVAKINMAGGPSGSLVGDLLEVGTGTVQSADLAPLTGPSFPIEIPDHSWITYDVVCICNNYRHQHQFRGVWAALGMFEVWRTQNHCAYIPDIVLAQAYWGANLPQRWRRRVRDWLKQASTSNCPEPCPFHRKSTKHGHHRLKLTNTENYLYRFAETDVGSVTKRFNFLSEDEPWSSKRRDEMNIGNVWRGYWPILIFGCSPAMGLTDTQVLTMFVITRELTRVGYEWAGLKKSGKPSYRRTPTLRVDRAQIYRHREVTASGKGTHTILCPLLDEAKEYVGFNSNLRYQHGRGYKLLGQGNSWVSWIYSNAEVQETEAVTWPQVQKMLDDFAVLADMFGLLIVGRHHPSRNWASLEEMRQKAKFGSGQDWLQECMVRIYAPADYLVRWRYEFAERLGFSWIPGGEDCPFPLTPTTNGVTIHDGPSLAAWLRASGMTQWELAEELGVSLRCISRRISASGTTTRTSGFWKSVNQLAASRATVAGHNES